MRRASLTWCARGGGILMLILTLRHSIDDSLEKNLSALLSAYKLMLNRPSWKTLAKRMGIEGSIRVLETTYGQNGWHPHLHILIYTKEPIDREQEAPLRDETEAIYAQWVSVVAKKGLPVPSAEHGVKLQEAEFAWGYIEKKAREGADAFAPVNSWDSASEMTKQTIKKAKGGYHPFELLRKYAGLPGSENKDFQLTPEIAAHRFREFAKHFAGKKQLLWSRGLRKMCGLSTVEKSNQVLAEEKIEKAVPFASLTMAEWQNVIHANRRGQVLAICRQGLAALQAYIKSLPEASEFFQRMKDRKVEKMLHNPVVNPKRKGDR